MICLLPKDLIYILYMYFYFFTAARKFIFGDPKGLPVHYHSADDISVVVLIVLSGHSHQHNGGSYI